MKRLMTVLGLVVILGSTVLVSCQANQTMWASCSPAANGDRTGTDGTYVLLCVEGRWEPIMTVQEYLALLRGERVKFAPLPPAPTSTTTSTTTSTSTSTTSTSTSTTTTIPQQATARVDVSGGTLDTIGVIGLSGAGSNYCYSASTCQVTFPLPNGVQIQLSSEDPFTVTCPGDMPQPADHFGPDYSGGCQHIGAVTDYAVAVSVP